MLNIYRKGVIALSLIASLFLSMFSKSVAADTKLVYLSMGDSIASGYGLDAKDTRYSALLCKDMAEQFKLNIDFGEVEEYGITTNEFLANIKYMDLSLVKDADLITVSLGSNDVLHPFLGVIYKNLGVKNETELSANILGIVKNLMSGNDMEKMGAAIQILNLSNALKGACDEKGAIRNAVEGFKKNWNEIFASLRKVNEDAVIVVNNFYNPYESLDLSMLIPADVKLPMDDLMEALNFAKIIEEVIGEMNEFVNSKKEEYSYDVSDVFSLFKGSIEKYTNIDFNITDGKLSLDPHPNTDGHAAIEKNIWGIFEEYVVDIPEEPEDVEQPKEEPKEEPEDVEQPKEEPKKDLHENSKDEAKESTKNENNLSTPKTSDSDGTAVVALLAVSGLMLVNLLACKRKELTK